MARNYHRMNVFTDHAQGGNPLVIVDDAQGLSSNEMLAIAHRFNVSETVFLLPPENPAHNAKIKIFTPTTEVPFAGHPTIGTAIFLASRRYGKIDSEQDALVVLEEKAGLVRVGVKLLPDRPAFAEFDTPQLPQPGTRVPDRASLSMVLGLTTSELGFENHVPSVYGVGLEFVLVPISGLDAMARIEVSEAAWRNVLGPGLGSLFVYCRDTQHSKSHFHARVFAPLLGIDEDPATGSAAAAFAGAIHKFDAPREGTHRYLIEQGFEMGRPSKISLELVVDHGTLHAVRIGGQAIHVESGVLEKTSSRS